MTIQRSILLINLSADGTTPLYYKFVESNINFTIGLRDGMITTTSQLLESYRYIEGGQAGDNGIPQKLSE